MRKRQPTNNPYIWFKRMEHRRQTRPQTSKTTHSIAWSETDGRKLWRILEISKTRALLVSNLFWPNLASTFSVEAIEWFWRPSCRRHLAQSMSFGHKIIPITRCLNRPFSIFGPLPKTPTPSTSRCHSVSRGRGWRWRRRTPWSTPILPSPTEERMAMTQRNSQMTQCYGRLKLVNETSQNYLL